MPNLKEDTALAANLLAQDLIICELLQLKTLDDKSKRIVPMRRQPNRADSKPLINVYIRPGNNLGGRTSYSQLLVDVYVPLSTQRDSGISFDITQRIKQVLDKKPIGRRLDYLVTNPDARSMTDWHKASVTFNFFSNQN